MYKSRALVGTVGKGLPAASRLDRLMNFFTEFFATV